MTEPAPNATPQTTTAETPPNPDATQQETEKAKSKQQGDPRQGLPSTVQVVQAAEPMQLQQTAPGATGPWIQYNGVATVRIMGPEEWKNVGIETDDYHEWSYMNKKRLPRSVFSDQQLQYLLRVDGRFSLVEDEKASETTE